MKSLAKYGTMSFGVGIVAFALTFASGFGPCGPSTPFDAFLISLGFVTTIGGSLMMIGAILGAAFGRRFKSIGWRKIPISLIDWTGNSQ